MADATYMDKLQAQAFRAGIQAGTPEARKWFANKLKEVKKVNRQELLREYDKVNNLGRAAMYGRMFMYFYNPKGKKDLPYYDRFPLIFLVEKAKGGFYGLNMHYLPPNLRAIFFDRLTSYNNNKKYDETTRLRLKYQTMKSASKLKYFKPCFKHYLNEHVASRIVEVPSIEWSSVMFLPSELFVKKGKSTVWKESRKIANS